MHACMVSDLPWFPWLRREEELHVKNMEKKIRAARSALPSGAKAGEIYKQDMDWLAYHNEPPSLF